MLMSELPDRLNLWDADCVEYGSGPPLPLEDGWVEDLPNPCNYVVPEIMEVIGVELSTIPPCSQVRMMQVPVITSFVSPVAPPAPPPPPPPPAPVPPAAPPPAAAPTSGSGSGGGGGGGGGTGPSGPSGPPEITCGEPTIMDVLVDVTCDFTIEPYGDIQKLKLKLTKWYKHVSLCLIDDGSSESSHYSIEGLECEVDIPCECDPDPTGPP